MTPSEISQYVGLALAIIALLGHAKGYFSSGEKQLAATVTELKEDCDANIKKLVEHDRRIQTVENDIRHLPNREATHMLELALAQISGRLDTLDERLKPIAATSGRLQEFLLEQAQK